MLPQEAHQLPRRALTAVSVERIKPPTKGQVEHFDKGYPGLALRVSYGGGKSFVFFYRVGGRLRRMTLGTYPALGLAEAREAWRTARQDTQVGRDPASSRHRETAAMDFQNVCEEWLKRDQAKNRSCADVKRAIDKDVMPVWGHRQVSDLGRRDVLDLIDRIADRGSPVMARRIHTHVHRFFKWCVGRGIIELNPAAGLPKPGAATRRDRVLTDDEFLTVWRGAEKLGWPHGNVVRLLLLTGARREEIGQLKWSEIIDGEIRLEGERTKNAQPHTIPLSPPALALIEQSPRIGDSGFIFTISGERAAQGWGVAKKRLDDLAPIAPWRIHDLRRTAATGLQKLGVSLQVVEAVLGHISGSRSGVVGIYQRHTYGDEKRGALKAWGQYVMALVENRPIGWVP